VKTTGSDQESPNRGIGADLLGGDFSVNRRTILRDAALADAVDRLLSIAGPRRPT